MLAVVADQRRGIPRGITSVCSAHPVVLRAAFEQALEDGSVVLVESTSNQVNQDGGYSGLRPAEFVGALHRLAAEAGLPPGRLVLGGDHLGPHPWRALDAASAMERAREMVRDYARAGYAKLHLDASATCAGDPKALPDELAAARTAELAAAAESAREQRPAEWPAPLYVIGTEVPPPGGRSSEQGGRPAVTRAVDAAEAIALTRNAFAARGLQRAWERVVAVVVQPGVEFGDETVYGYERAQALPLRVLAESHKGLLYEAHSTDYQPEASLRALVEDHFAVLKVGPELTFAFREAVFALAEIERELLGRRAPERLSGLRAVLDEAMRRDPRHWQSFYAGDGEEARLRRAFSRSDRCRYYWPRPEVAAALERLFSNLEAQPLPIGLVSQYLPEAVGSAAETPAAELPRRVARQRVRRVLARYARACAPGTSKQPVSIAAGCF